MLRRLPPQRAQHRVSPRAHPGPVLQRGGPARQVVSRRPDAGPAARRARQVPVRAGPGQGGARPERGRVVVVAVERAVVRRRLRRRVDAAAAGAAAAGVAVVRGGAGGGRGRGRHARALDGGEGDPEHFGDLTVGEAAEETHFDDASLLTIILGEAVEDRLGEGVDQGERVGFHRHVLNYFWVAINPGKSRSHYATGETLDAEYEAGTTKHFSFARGEFMLHDLENIGDTDLVFTTVEFKNAPNEPLPI